MFFVIIAEHTAENCPGGLIRPDKQFTAKLDESMKKSGVKVVEGYLDAPGHVWYFIVDANDVRHLIMPLNRSGLWELSRFLP